MISALTTIQTIDKNLAKTQASVAAEPVIKRESAYYLANIQSIKSAKSFVNNYKLFSFAMTAYGLSDMISAKALMEQVMEGGISNSKSLANQLTDPRFKAFATAFNFGDDGAAATSNATSNANTVNDFVEQTLENNVGQQNQGAQIALYFQRLAPTITSGFQVLGDKTLFQFVQTAFNIPPVISSSALDQFATAIEKRLNLSSLNDPAAVQKLVTQFAANWDMQHSSLGANPTLALFTPPSSSSSSVQALVIPSATSTSSNSSNPELLLFSSPTSSDSQTFGISPDLLLQAQNLYGVF